MIESGKEFVPLLMLLGILVGSLMGYTLAIVVGAIGLGVGLIYFGPSIATELYYSRMYELLNNYTFLAIPLFVFMGSMLEYSGIADDLYDALYLFLGRIRGGLAVSTVIIGTIMAAAVGIIGASVSMLSLVALPSMVKKGYNKPLACGAVMAGGTLGILIPPSVMLVVYGPMASMSVGKLMMAAFMPGFLLSLLYCTYILTYAWLNPEKAPAISREESGVALITKLKRLFISLVPPALLIFSVLGVIFFGIAPPTEAASIGAATATILAILYRKFNFTNLRAAAITTIKVSGTVMLIGTMAYAFVGVFIRLGGDEIITNALLSAPGGRWGVFFLVMFICFLLGFVMEWIGVIFIMVPIITPIVAKLGFDPLWFAMMICVNLQTSFMTPPMAPAIFYLKSSANPALGITMANMMVGVIPFVTMVLIGLGLCIYFPQIILWLPSIMLGQ
jgi:tripartite ATP-independent transporter DctM subunit